MNRLWQHRYETAISIEDKDTRAYHIDALTQDMRRAASKASLDGEIIVAQFLLKQALKVEINATYS